MSFFNSLLGLKSYSSYQFLLSREEIDDLVARSAISSLTLDEEKIVENAIDARRLGDGRISMVQIDETLRSLENQGKISRNDRECLLKIFDRFSKAKLKNS